ncbi:hypothetical protein H3H36_13815 [Duganella sp. FT3S]|uniref:Uncharacterized protein n=1 Tax=Rugamonas fusca TaxID=2758568 RepID=A0A7W2EIL4_9BURK|nr:hypothetical protein [Rugamonas fusca]MBA5606430.1 hypothetical protein [Rugamonas fusca]
MKIKQRICALGAELKNIHPVDAIDNDGLCASIQQAFLEHKVRFLRTYPV